MKARYDAASDQFRRSFTAAYIRQYWLMVLRWESLPRLLV